MTWKRYVALISLVAHLVLVGAGPVADAIVELADAAASETAHVEDANLPSCARHQHATCIVCRALHTLDVASIDRGSPWNGSRPSVPVRPGYAQVLPIDAWLASVSPRAPPRHLFS